jgi:hypothetical protein
MIPLIICSYNQPTYLMQMCLQWKWYYPEYPIYIFDNGSDVDKVFTGKLYPTDKIFHYADNNFIPNLTDFLNKHIHPHYSHYVISDPDILIHPATPPNFLDYFMEAINQGYHRAGFGLMFEDIPAWNEKQAWIQGNERELLTDEVEIFGAKGFKAPLDTTFCLYSTKRPWTAPMNGQDWGNCVRMFKAFHMTWYIDPERVNPEMDFYFKTAKAHITGQPSAGANNNRPKQYITHIKAIQ